MATEYRASDEARHAALDRWRYDANAWIDDTSELPPLTQSTALLGSITPSLHMVHELRKWMASAIKRIPAQSDRTHRAFCDALDVVLDEVHTLVCTAQIDAAVFFRDAYEFDALCHFVEDNTAAAASKAAAASTAAEARTSRDAAKRWFATLTLLARVESARPTRVGGRADSGGAPVANRVHTVFTRIYDELLVELLAEIKRGAAAREAPSWSAVLQRKLRWFLRRAPGDHFAKHARLVLCAEEALSSTLLVGKGGGGCVPRIHAFIEALVQEPNAEFNLDRLHEGWQNLFCAIAEVVTLAVARAVARAIRDDMQGGRGEAMGALLERARDAKLVAPHTAHATCVSCLECVLLDLRARFDQLSPRKVRSETFVALFRCRASLCALKDDKAYVSAISEWSANASKPTWGAGIAAGVATFRGAAPCKSTVDALRRWSGSPRSASAVEGERALPPSAQGVSTGVALLLRRLAWACHGTKATAKTTASNLLGTSTGSGDCCHKQLYDVLHSQSSRGGDGLECVSGFMHGVLRSGSHPVTRDAATLFTSILRDIVSVAEDVVAIPSVLLTKGLFKTKKEVLERLEHSILRPLIPSVLLTCVSLLDVAAGVDDGDSLRAGLKLLESVLCANINIEKPWEAEHRRGLLDRALSLCFEKDDPYAWPKWTKLRKKGVKSCTVEVFQRGKHMVDSWRRRVVEKADAATAVLAVNDVSDSVKHAAMSCLDALEDMDMRLTNAIRAKTKASGDDDVEPEDPEGGDPEVEMSPKVGGAQVKYSSKSYTSTILRWAVDGNPSLFEAAKGVIRRRVCHHESPNAIIEQCAAWGLDRLLTSSGFDRSTSSLQSAWSQQSAERLIAVLGTLLSDVAEAEGDVRRKPCLGARARVAQRIRELCVVFLTCHPVVRVKVSSLLLPLHIRESCSQFDSLPLTSLTISHRAREARRARHARARRCMVHGRAVVAPESDPPHESHRRRRVERCAALWCSKFARARAIGPRLATRCRVGWEKVYARDCGGKTHRSASV